MPDSSPINRLRRQVEEIKDNRDRSKGDIYDVIVRVNSPGRAEFDILSNVAEVMSRRRTMLSARECLPPKRKELEKLAAARKTTSRSVTREARSTRSDKNSMAAQVARRVSTASTDVTLLRERNEAALEALDALAPLLASDAVREATDRTSRARNKKTKPVRFWTSNSALIQVSDADLDNILRSSNEIEDIYLNRQLSIPPISRPAREVWPNTVEDNKTSSWGVRHIGALAAWGAYDARGKDVVVGLLDTGVDPNHPDLKGKIEDWAEFDAKGDRVTKTKPRDSDRHGTHCAGTIVGGKESERWIGVAPEATLAVGMVLDGARGGTDAQILAGIQWAVTRGVDVISMSLGGLVLGPQVPSVYTRAILSAMQAGIPVVTAIGNEGSQTSSSPGSDYFAFAVGATDTHDRAAGFSGGRTQIVDEPRFFPPTMLPLVYSKPDVSAPGVAVYSSIPTTSGLKNPWEHSNGTSMAAPHVAGSIALLLSATSIRTNDKITGLDRAFLIQDLLIGSALELGEAGQNHRYGFGRIDVLGAIGWAKELGY